VRAQLFAIFPRHFMVVCARMVIRLAPPPAMRAPLVPTSAGVAGVPAASLVLIAPTRTQFNIPEAGLLMIMGIHTFLDMGRSATNVIGNSLATAVVAKWEGELAPEHALGPDDSIPVDTAAGEALPAH